MRIVYGLSRIKKMYTVAVLRFPSIKWSLWGCALRGLVNMVEVHDDKALQKKSLLCIRQRARVWQYYNVL